MEREGAKKNVLTFIHGRVFSRDYACNVTRVVISRATINTSVYTLPIRKIYQMQDNRKKENLQSARREESICNFPVQFEI